MKTTKEILVEARAIIADPVRWTQGEYALDAQGEHIEPWHSNAVCWCSIGSIEKVRGSRNRWDILGYFDFLIPFGGLANFNDNHTRAEVLEAFDKAIASCAG